MRFDWDIFHFEWDDAKAEANARKHDVDFREAATVFGDGFQREETDPVNVDSEARIRTIGYSDEDKLLMVCWTDREGSDGEDTIRIVSARRATPRERRNYHEQHQ